MEDAPETPDIDSAQPLIVERDDLLVRGVFALYHTPNGGMHLSWRGDGEDEKDTHHVEVPAFAVKMAQVQMAGEGGGLMGKLMGKIGGAR